MKKTIAVILLLFTLTLTACNSANSPADNPASATEIASSFVSNFLSKDFDKMLSDYTLSTKVKEALTKKLLEQIHGNLIATYGEFEEIMDTKTVENNGATLITFVSKFNNKVLEISVAIDSNKAISSFTYTESTVEVPGDDYVYFGDKEYELRGKLTIPEGEGPFPALIIVHGSGIADMDCTVGASTPYKDIAESLKNQGIAVLRYDKRSFTHREKIVQQKDFTVKDEYIDDSHYALEFLQSQQEIDSNNIFIAAHSQSGYLIPRIAKENTEAKGFIVLAGMVTRTEDLIVEQTDYLIDLDGNVTNEEQQYFDQLKSAQEMLKNLDNLPEEAYVLGAPKSYWLDLKDYEPLEQITEIKRPVLFLQGERDYQVTMSQFNQWKQATNGLDNFSFKSYPKLNHLLIAGEGTPSPQEYQAGGTVSQELINDIATFISENN